MKQQKSHARINQLRELRDKSKTKDNSPNITKQKFDDIIKTARVKKKVSNFQIEQGHSLIIPNNKKLDHQQRNLNIFDSQITKQIQNKLKVEDTQLKRQPKSSRQVSRKKIISKDKFSLTSTDKRQISIQQIKRQQLLQQLQIVSSEQFIREKQQTKEKQLTNKNKKAFWTKQHIFVSLFILQHNEDIIFNHTNILPVYGQVNIDNLRYVVSNEYNQSTLNDLIYQFGVFDQALSKHYLIQIIMGLEQIHNRKIAHNRLTADNILYNKEGNILINVVKSTSRALNEKQRITKLYQYCPQILLTKSNSNSLRNDIWSIGILLLQMLFNFSSVNAKTFQIHPYNRSQSDLTPNDAIIIDNLKQLFGKGFQIINEKKQVDDEMVKKYQSLSMECKDFIGKCLSLNKEDRPSIKSIKEHAFFNK